MQSQDVFDMTEVGLGNILRLLPKGDLQLFQYCNYSFILSMIAKLCSFFLKMTLLILVLRVYGCYRIFQLHI